MILGIKNRLKIRLPHIVNGSLILCGFSALSWWIMKDPVRSFAPSVPGMDNRGQGVVIESSVTIGEFFESFGDMATDLQETWPRFRGSDYDNISKSPVRLAEKFSPGLPPVKWTVEMGEGHAGAAIYKGKVYVLDHDEELRADMLRCFSLETGQELWRRWYKVMIKRNHGMSRTVPAISDKYILTFGPKGHVMCVDRETGDFRWGMDIVKEYKSEVPLWYTGQCPLIDQDKAILATGGKAIMIAVDCESGSIIWETPNEKGWKMSHSSIIPYEFGGRKMYVYSSFGGVCGIAADGEDAGSIL